MTPRLIVRARRDEDLPRCAEVLREVHERDGYPTHWPGDPVQFVGGHGTLAAWVAVRDDEIVGHVALAAAETHSVWDVCVTATGVPAAQLGVIARLFVVPVARGAGVAGTLLAAATGEARRRELTPVLDVTVDGEDSIAFYERRGWRRVGEATLDLTDPPGATLDMALYVGPR